MVFWIWLTVLTCFLFKSSKLIDCPICLIDADATLTFSWAALNSPADRAVWAIFCAAVKASLAVCANPVLDWLWVICFSVNCNLLDKLAIFSKACWRFLYICSSCLYCDIMVVILLLILSKPLESSVESVPFISLNLLAIAEMLGFILPIALSIWCCTWANFVDTEIASFSELINSFNLLTSDCFTISALPKLLNKANDCEFPPKPLFNDWTVSFNPWMDCFILAVVDWILSTSDCWMSSNEPVSLLRA